MSAVLILRFLTTLLCAVLQLRAYAEMRRRLLLWSGLCFLLLSVSNLLVFFDLQVYVTTDLYSWRLGTTALAMVLLMYGLIWEAR